MIRSRNLSLIIGNVGSDPEIRKNDQNMTTAIFSVATSEDRKTKEGEIKVHTEWHRIVSYGKLAEMVEAGIKKSLKVCVMGKSRSSTWEDQKTGQKRTSWSIEADDVFIHVREYSYQSHSSNNIPDEDTSKMTDDDIPF